MSERNNLSKFYIDWNGELRNNDFFRPIIMVNYYKIDDVLKLEPYRLSAD